jgi:cellulose synthase/poly-beta-1,6-N-acetylglucosamine synthase-like glycosyltransferase
MPGLPSISVVVPCDAAHIPLLPRLLEHITTWDCTPSEVVVAASRVRRSGQTDSLTHLTERPWPFRVVCLPTSKRQAAGPNRNRGAKAVTASHVLFLDADDLMAPWATEFITRAFWEYHPDVVMYSYTENVQVFHPRPTWSVHNVVAAQVVRAWYAQDMEQLLHSEPTPLRVSEDATKRVHHGSIAIRRNVLDDVQYGKRRLAEDLEFCRQLMERGYSVVYLDEPLLGWTHSHSTTTGLRVELSRNRARASRLAQRLARGARLGRRR